MHLIIKNITFILCVSFSLALYSQESLSELLNRFNSNKIPYISVHELAMPKTEAIILDARELNEYKVSHLENAIYVGYTEFDIDKTSKQLKDKKQKIVVYCSLGIRSEAIALQLKKAGYTNIFNLYGGIFEWKNNDFTVVDSKERITEQVHACNKQWSKWLLKGEKVYD